MEQKTSLKIYISHPEKDTSDDTPVVLLLGWAGCQDKYLQKYSKVYEDKGYITVRYCSPVSHTFWDTAGSISSAKNIVKFINETKLEKHPLILHIFSNGGAFLYEHLSKELRKGPHPIDVKGVIFDSCPGERRVVLLFRVMQEIFGSTPVIGPLIASIIFSLLLSMYLLQMFYYNIKEKFFGYTPGSDPYRALLNDETTYPELFFYSHKDHVVLTSDVEYFADYREKKFGVKTTKICFEDSLHVKHFMAHPEIYKNSIQKFLDECLN